MLVKVTAKRQVTLPARVLEALCAKPGDHLRIEESAKGSLLRPRRVDHGRPAPLSAKPRFGHGTFELEAFRDQPRATALRD